MSGSESDLQAVDILRDQVARIEAFERTGHPFRMLQHGLHVWPLVKYLLVKQTIFAMGRGFASSDAFEVHTKTLHKRDVTRQGWLKSYRMRRRARSFDLDQILPSLKDLPTTQTDPVLLFGSATGFQDTAIGRVSVHHHALRTALVARGHSVMAFYADAPRAADLATCAPDGSALDLDPVIQHINRIASMTAYAQEFLRSIFPDLDRVTHPTGHRVESLCAYADILTGQILAATVVMSALMDRLKPRAVFTSNYASIHGWAMSHVCRQAGIPCIDIQHGIEGRHNGAYHFAATPPEDWNILPTHHLTWTQEDADFFTGQHANRRAAVMGTHTGQLAYLTDTSAQGRLQTLQVRRPILLFTAQFAQDILVARDLARAGLSVIFRCHPTRQNETHALVDAADLEALHCQIGSETSLNTLIRTCDGLITGYSATILEAAELSKPVFAIGAFADLLASDYSNTLRGTLTVDPEHGGSGLADRLRSWSQGLVAASAASRSTPPDLDSVLDSLQAEV